MAQMAAALRVTFLGQVRTDPCPEIRETDCSCGKNAEGAVSSNFNNGPYL